MGSGKSTITKLLKPKLKRTAVYSADDIKWFISDFKRSKNDNGIVQKVVLKMFDEYLKNGISVLMEKGPIPIPWIIKFTRIAKKYNCTIKFYHFTSPKEVLINRVNKRPTARDATSPLPRARIIRNLNNKTTYPGATVIDTSTLKPNQVVNLILKDLKSK